MKNFLYHSLFICSLTLNLYFFANNSEPDYVWEDQVALQKSALKKKVKDIPGKRHENNLKFIEDDMAPGSKSDPVEAEQALEDSEREKFAEWNQEQYQEAQKNWRKEARSYIERDLGLAPDVADLYFDLSEKRSQEISDYVTPKVSDSDQDEPYVFSIEDNIQVAQINKKYLDSLKDAMGEENYLRYKKYRQKLNHKFMEEGRGYFWVEF